MWKGSRIQGATKGSRGLGVSGLGGNAREPHGPLPLGPLKPGTSGPVDQWTITIQTRTLRVTTSFQRKFWWPVPSFSLIIKISETQVWWWPTVGIGGGFLRISRDLWKDVYFFFFSSISGLTQDGSSILLIGWRFSLYIYSPFNTFSFRSASLWCSYSISFFFIRILLIAILLLVIVFFNKNFPTGIWPLFFFYFDAISRVDILARNSFIFPFPSFSWFYF